MAIFSFKKKRFISVVLLNSCPVLPNTFQAPEALQRTTSSLKNEATVYTIRVIDSLISGNKEFYPAVAFQSFSIASLFFFFSRIPCEAAPDLGHSDICDLRFATY
jgi:hypothetical protein